MSIVNLILIFLLQAPPLGQKVVVGLLDGRQIVMDNPEFTGFIEGRNGDAILMYRQQKFHGEMPMKTISRIDFGEYEKGKPFSLTVTLRNGQKIQVESERRAFVTLKGNTDLGTVTIKHPDPTLPPVKLTTKKSNRKNDLTIQYLEIPAS
jgi:hypothetical protein